MASGKTLNAKNLAALGADRLATLVLDLAAGDAAAKRQLRLELASQAGGDEVATEIRKRLVSIGKSRSFVSWRKVHDLQQDLETQLRAITQFVAPAQPAEAFDLLWRFLALAPSIYERCDDGNGVITGIMADALALLGDAALTAKIPNEILAERAFDAMCSNGYNQYDGLIHLIAKPLGNEGLSTLKTKFEDMSQTLPPQVPETERRVIGISSKGVVYEDDTEHNAQVEIIRSALLQIADAMGDIESYVAAHCDDDRKNPAIAARIAERLLTAGRAQDAFQALALAEPVRRKGGYWPDWDRVRVSVFDTLEQFSDAQDLRWDLFEHDLNAEWLRQYLKKLPDFEDMEAEERAIEYALNYPEIHKSLLFLMEWPALPFAAQLILERSSLLDGTHYELLTKAADTLEHAYPLAATVTLRVMIDFALDRARHKRYRHAARHLRSCEALAPRIENFGEHPDHQAYVAELKSAHKQKTGFWNA
jgi:hypothetical protein